MNVARACISQTTIPGIIVNCLNLIRTIQNRYIDSNIIDFINMNLKKCLSLNVVLDSLHTEKSYIFFNLLIKFFAVETMNKETVIKLFLTAS